VIEARATRDAHAAAEASERARVWRECVRRAAVTLRRAVRTCDAATNSSSHNDDSDDNVDNSDSLDARLIDMLQNDAQQLVAGACVCVCVCVSSMHVAPVLIYVCAHSGAGGTCCCAHSRRYNAPTEYAMWWFVLMRRYRRRERARGQPTRCRRRRTRTRSHRARAQVRRHVHM
jgi:hypothetical protein